MLHHFFYTYVVTMSTSSKQPNPFLVKSSSSSSSSLSYIPKTTIPSSSTSSAASSSKSTVLSTSPPPNYSTTEAQDDFDYEYYRDETLDTQARSVDISERALRKARDAEQIAASNLTTLKMQGGKLWDSSLCHFGRLAVSTAKVLALCFCHAR